MQGVLPPIVLPHSLRAHLVPSLLFWLLCFNFFSVIFLPMSSRQPDVPVLHLFYDTNDTTTGPGFAKPTYSVITYAFIILSLLLLRYLIERVPSIFETTTISHVAYDHIT